MTPYELAVAEHERAGTSIYVEGEQPIEQRLLDDGALYATVWDMIVDPAHQRAGQGAVGAARPRPAHYRRRPHRQGDGREERDREAVGIVNCEL